MLKTLRVKISQGKQFVPDVKGALPRGFRGLPQFSPTTCPNTCNVCMEACPVSGAIATGPLRMDLGLCVFCNDCAAACPQKKISFSENYKISSDSLEGLIVDEKITGLQVRANDAIKKIFGRSLKLRSVSAGGCNGCELELNAAGNVNFDMGRFGIEFVASPRHADGLVISGPISENMAEALELAYEGMPDPKFVIAVGACAITGGLYKDSDALDRRFLEQIRPVLYVPGCAIHPLAFINGVLGLLGR
ncbi:MAG: NADH:ubiquinone oxidoreductase [Bdellovibrionales bacterium RIFOXYD12_FULL_39_22]|nr:MAG: NADH:ubiquinone oxidoreductase [Bdellovibrionales bacterium RIFOXYB1_FULL_39_21]OFZ44685.1 MAG: NADH:ubiquinone oxidoreductase [Bdellovibrionales bacterium RIFOXYC12_FULL_39_17]OFZ49315.1 MAG: NADH:ubiquinone oxidoreductase [Bdellovibrionales bacterium RIFOXYC1_FULL_39_130]OFZ76800.1 MAG: NADH:ubiquinone oxidoreductase [Bdellovibrionales bacterium RIFOXYC2_FULL_39_8]OFZ77051.1 MAG: NADH:ubiquinone oxidoreductase [Bdellovibrionales bacterium RIFOXYD1_FULL_39_84]OFZ95311.1 MAG: NADH:ubiq